MLNLNHFVMKKHTHPNACFLMFILMGICVLTNFPLIAQEKEPPWKFNVLDHQQQPIPSVTWILKHLPTDETLGFGKTDEQGTFQIDFSSLPTLIELELSLKHLAYEDQAVKLHPQQNQYIITLIEKAIRITDVEVGNRPKISQRGDTLRYLLHDFIDTNDRNVGDALKKLPGLSVLASGKVLFNGQAISGMLIDGDDLFGGKYGIGTRAISSTA